VQQIHDRFGKIDILINNAGILRDKSFLKMTHDMWQKVIDVNLTGVFNCTKAVVPIMVENKYGRIISTSSIVGMTGNYGQTNYVAAKAGIIGMTKTWARELGKHGITANAIAPGYIITEMTATIPPEVLKGVIGQIPVGRAGQPEDMAHGFLYIASEEAGFLSGQTITINGGVY
jgi:3-oxoacyl-[acyl-carrier protein] reductase